VLPETLYQKAQAHGKPQIHALKRPKGIKTLLLLFEFRENKNNGLITIRRKARRE